MTAHIVDLKPVGSWSSCIIIIIITIIIIIINYRRSS